jgi:hypothetical protein
MKKQAYLLLLSSLIFLTIATVLQVYENTELATYRAADSYSYEEAASRIYDLGFQPHPTRPFLYPLILGLPKLFTNDYSLLLRFNYALNFLFWLLTILFIYKSIVLISKPIQAFLCALLFAFNISNILINPQILTESVYTFTLSLIVFFLTKYCTTHKISHLTSAISIFTLSILIRPSGLILALIIVPIHIIYLYKKRSFTQIALILVIISCPLLQMTRMAQYKMNFTISNIGTETLYYYLCGYAEAVKTSDYAYSNYSLLQSNYEKIRIERLSIMTAMEGNNGWKNKKTRAMNDFEYQLTHNFKGLAFSYIRSIVSNSVAFSTFSVHTENVNNSQYFASIAAFSVHITRLQNAMYSLSIIFTPFILVYFRKKTRHKSLLYLQISILTLAIYTMLISGISFAQGDRFNIVLVPIALANMALMYKLLYETKPVNPLK